MKVGDLVEVTKGVFAHSGLAVIIELDEPTVRRPYQIATVQFVDGSENKFVTTILRILK